MYLFQVKSRTISGKVASVRVPAAMRTASACKAYGLWPACVRLIPVSAWTCGPRCLDLWAQVVRFPLPVATRWPSARRTLSWRKASAGLPQGGPLPTGRAAGGATGFGVDYFSSARTSVIMSLWFSSGCVRELSTISCPALVFVVNVAV